eukprot:8607718-Pyramimonas_sp.AAC.1
MDSAAENSTYSVGEVEHITPVARTLAVSACLRVCCVASVRSGPSSFGFALPSSISRYAPPALSSFVPV